LRSGFASEYPGRPSRHVPTATPRPLLRCFTQPRAHRVLEQVVDHDREVRLVLDQPGGEAAAEEVAAAPVLGIEGLRVAAVQALHPGREQSALRFDDEVVVVAHQAEGVQLPAVALGSRAQQREKEEPILVVAEDQAPRDPARDHVVDPVGEETARHSRHPADASGRGRWQAPVWTHRHEVLTPRHLHRGPVPGLSLDSGRRSAGASCPDRGQTLDGARCE
jgi:hypothetical protein